VALLPSSMTGASDTTYTGDGLWTASGWRVARAGGRADVGGRVGALCLALRDVSTFASTDFSSRLCYAA